MTTVDARRRAAVGVGWLVLTASPAFAGTLDHFFDPGTTYATMAITEFATSGDMMDGMEVQAFFDNGTDETVFWADTGVGSGAATGTGWSLAQSGDTFFSPWFLFNDTGVGLTRLLIDAGVGDTVFDLTWAPEPGTAGSAAGQTFAIVAGGDPYDLDVTYRDLITLSGDGPVGDLWRRLELAFETTPLRSGDVLEFLQDTDNLEIAGDLTPVPEPSTVALLAFCLLFLRRRRR